MLLKSFRNVFINVGKYNCKEKEFFYLLRNRTIESLHIQTRNATIVKRRHPAPLFKLHNDWRTAKLYDKHYIYDVVEDTDKTIKAPLKLLLIQPVQEVGQPGEVVEVSPDFGRTKLLLPGFAVYASPDNLKKYENLKSSTDVEVPSSSHVLKTLKMMENKVSFVTMNSETPWQIEPWHVRVGLRKVGIIAPNSAISLPSKPITGPDTNLENKEFLARVKINNKEEAKIRVRVHHVSTEKMNRLPYVENYWLKRAEPVFPDDLEQVAILDDLNNKDKKLMATEDEE